MNPVYTKINGRNNENTKNSVAHFYKSKSVSGIWRYLDQNLFQKL